MRAFSLVELSIVLVILGLLTGGILAGQSLIRAAEIRGVATDTQRFTTAVASFRDKYFAIPGDMNNAVRFWGVQAGGTADGVDATCVALTTAATGAATCNGDGNGFIADNFGTSGYEGFRFWQHLANAGLVEGQYSGISAGGAGTYKATIGVNVPRSRVPGAGFTILYYAPVTDPAAAGYFVSPMGNIFWFGKDTHPNYTANPALTNEEQWNVDTKLDDGKPTSGYIIATKVASCVTSTTAPADYLLSGTGYNCRMIILSRV